MKRISIAPIQGYYSEVTILRSYPSMVKRTVLRLEQNSSEWTPGSKQRQGETVPDLGTKDWPGTVLPIRCMDGTDKEHTLLRRALEQKEQRPWTPKAGQQSSCR